MSVDPVGLPSERLPLKQSGHGVDIFKAEDVSIYRDLIEEIAVVVDIVAGVYSIVVGYQASKPRRPVDPLISIHAFNLHKPRPPCRYFYLERCTVGPRGRGPWPTKRQTRTS